MIPAVIGLLGTATLIGGLMDYMTVSNQKAALQDLADAAALSAVREFALSTDNPDRIEFVASAYVASVRATPDITSTPVADPDTGRITVTVEAPPNARFPGPFSKMETVSATATAEFVGSPGNVCMIGLNPTASQTVYLDKNAYLYAPECAVYSNSSSTSGLVSNSNALLEAEAIYTVGGWSGSGSNFSDAPITDTAPISDPLALRPNPSVGACDYMDREVEDVTTTIMPGVYCGGLQIDDNARVTIAPGDYIMKDGPLVFDENAEVTGTDVSFFLTGSDAYFEFNGNADVSLSARTTGPMAGLLFFEDPANSATEHLIKSNYANYLVGTVYLPKSKFRVDADTPVADLSEFTIVVAREIELNSSPQLYLNTGYDLSTVPVPDGVGPIKDGAVRLVD